MESNTQIRAIVPGREGKTLNAATLRPVVVERLNNEGPLTLGNAAIKVAEKTFKDFHGVYSALYVMVALPEAEPNPLFEAIWQMLMLPDSEKVILTIITTDSDGGQLSIETKNLPVGWRWEWMETGPEGNEEDAHDIFDDHPLEYGLRLPENNTNHL